MITCYLPTVCSIFLISVKRRASNQVGIDSSLFNTYLNFVFILLTAKIYVVKNNIFYVIEVVMVGQHNSR